MGVGLGFIRNVGKVTAHPLEPILIAGTFLAAYVVTTQAAVSLLGRRVPLGLLDEAVVRPHHRRGIALPIGILLMAAIAVGTQLGALVGLQTASLGGLALPAYAVELVLAATWTILLASTSRSPRRANPTPRP